MSKIETRTIEIIKELEVRMEGEGENKLVGYAAIFNSLSADLGGFRERILPGAFRQSVETSADIRALVGHDSAKLLGRTSSGTLRLSEDATGLRFEIDLPEGVTYAADLRALVKRRDIRGMSFGFIVRSGGERFIKDGGHIIRELSAVELTEVSVVASPAYGSTSVQLRVDPAAVEAAKAAGNCPTIAQRLLQWVEQIEK